MAKVKIRSKLYPFKIFKVKFEFVDFDRLNVLFRKYNYQFVFGESAVMVWVSECDLDEVMEYIGRDNLEGNVLDMNLKNEDGRLNCDRMRQRVTILAKMVNM